MTRPKHAHARRMQCVSTWVALVCLGAQLSAAGHRVLVEHTHCAEHGEWVHAGQDHAEEHGAAQGGPDGSAVVVSPTSAAQDHGHDHCATCAERRYRGLIPPAVDLGIGPVAGPCVAPHAAGARPRAASIYGFAPKASPPLQLG